MSSYFMRPRPTFYACIQRLRFAYVPTMAGEPVGSTKGQWLYAPALPGIRLFLHRHKKDWCISEATTGLLVATAPARDMLHIELEARIRRGVDYFRQNIERRPKLPTQFANPTYPC